MEDFKDFGLIDSLTIHGDFDHNGQLEFLSGHHGEAHVERDEVVRLIEHLSHLVGQYDKRRASFAASPEA